MIIIDKFSNNLPLVTFEINHDTPCYDTYSPDSLPDKEARHIKETALANEMYSKKYRFRSAMRIHRRKSVQGCFRDSNHPS